ncbi:er membrane protein complex subunit 4 [Anaeramoeba flamelloides]|uniref:ER membrane protein complex subunit 4 n=1 Tax=Anaeramoeba flamelloides TaxID=1746091 RepID=A0AAV7Z388_9EUKA|nr:er membrane protein complex subunit [Anaeramoeba flamelloides]KAJ6226077.1 er membrane protein complex subunit 4 [Anaeramoeba flamelloides]
MIFVDFKEEQSKQIPFPLGMTSPEKIINPERFKSYGLKKSKSEKEDLVLKKATQLAYGTAKSILPSILMLFFSARSLNIFAIMVVSMNISNAIQGIFSVGAFFQEFKKSKKSLWYPKLVYIAVKLALLGFAIYRVYKLGLLPTFKDFESHQLPKYEGLFFGGGFSQ